MKKVTNNNSSSAAGPNKAAAGAAAATPQHTYRWISVLLVIGHVVETALQIYLINHYWQLTTRWAAGLAALLTATVAIINAASIIGVRRGLDFADRWFGQCLCYVMHFSLLGMVWRFLKLTFLYDRTDLREFALLRFVQVHLQTMPSLLLQTCLIYQHGLLNADVTAVPIGLAITQLIVAGTTIALTTLVLSMPTSGIIAAAPAPQPPPPLATSSVKCADEEKMITAFPSRLRQKEERGCSGHQCIITAVRSICLLWCRTVAVGVFMTEFHVWTLIVFGVHWCITLLWLVLQDSASELPNSGYATAPPSPAVSLFRRALVAYLLVFDWPPRYQPKHSGWSASHKAVNPAAIVPAVGSWLDVVGLGGEPRSVAVALYYGISGVENAAMLSLWFHFAPPSILVPPVARLTTLATCTAALTLGVLCVVASTQGPDEETPSSSSSSSATLTSNRTTYTTSDSTSLSASSASNTSSLKPAATAAAFVPPCTVSQQREIRTVVAQVHPPRPTTTRLTQAALNMAANHSHPPMEPPPPPPPETTWERAISVCDDESSNSRNTNTMDGALTLGPGSGSGSCPSPPLYNVAMSGGPSSSPVVNMSTHPVPVQHRSHQASPFRDPSTFTASQNSYRVAKTVGTAGLAKTSAILAQQMDVMVKRPYLSGCPLSSTPRLVRRNSSFGSSLMIKSTRSSAARGGVCKSGIRSAHTTGRHRRRHRAHQNHHGCRPRGSKGACHCRIFDDYGMGILIKENPISKSGTLTSGGRNSSGRLSHGLFTTAETDASKPQLQIRCAKCLGAHDPLLTNCVRSKRQSMAAAKATGSGVKSKTLPSRHHKISGARTQHPRPQLDTSMCSTNYPSDTEVTCTGGRRSVSSSSGSSTDGSSTSSLDSDATYTTWPPSIRIPSMERLLSENTDPSPWNYVQAWLVNANQPQTRPRPLPAGAASGTGTARGTIAAIGTAKRIVKRLGGSPVCGAQAGQVQYLMRPHRHNHQAVGGVQDVYSAYCTVPPRLGQTVKELSVVRRSQKSSASPAAVEHQYSTPSVVQYSTPTSSTTSAGLEIVV